MSLRYFLREESGKYTGHHFIFQILKGGKKRDLQVELILYN